MNSSENNFNIRFLGYIPFFFVFLPSLAIYFGKKSVLVFFIVLSAFFIALFLLRPKYLINHLYGLFKKTPFRYMAYWSAWVIASGFLLVLFGKFTIMHYIYYMILYLVINVLCSLILPTVIINTKKSLLFILKFMMSAIYIIFILGIINFIGSKFDINVINLFFCAINNARGFSGTLITYGQKVYSVFAEPGWFGSFITFILPILYSVSKSKFKLYGNLWIDMFFKKTCVPLALLNIILTRSPIWLIVCFSTYFILVLIRNKRYLFTNKLKFAGIILVFLSLITYGTFKIVQSAESEQTNLKYLSRITVTIRAIAQKDFADFVENEESLASRVTSYINSLRIFKDYPITGIGLGNAKFYIIEKFNTSPVPLTVENYRELNTGYSLGYMKFNEAFLYQLLSETGIVGLFLYYIFLLNVYKRLTSVRKFYSGISLDFLTGLQRSMFILFSIFLIYDVSIANFFVWIILGIALSLIYIPTQTTIMYITALPNSETGEEISNE